MTASGAAHHLRPRREVFTGGGDTVEGEYAKDTWDAFRLGVPARRGHNIARFGAVTQEWLREAIKRWSRFRLAAGYSFTTIDAGPQALARFSLFLTDHPEVHDQADISRELLEEFLLWMASSRWSTNTRSHTLFVRQGLPRLGSSPQHAARAARQRRDLRGGSEPPTGQPPEVHPRIRHGPARVRRDLALLPSVAVRHLVVLLMETGLRGGDACELPFNPIIEDTVGWPCLGFVNAKVRAEQLMPLSDRAAATIRAQQASPADIWVDAVCRGPGATECTSA